MKNKKITMNEMYKDGSDHIACQECGFCITCNDCICDIKNKLKKSFK